MLPRLLFLMMLLPLAALLLVPATATAQCEDGVCVTAPEVAVAGVHACPLLKVVTQPLKALKVVKVVKVAKVVRPLKSIKVVTKVVARKERKPVRRSVRLLFRKRCQ